MGNLWVWTPQMIAVYSMLWRIARYMLPLSDSMSDSLILFVISWKCNEWAASIFSAALNTKTEEVLLLIKIETPITLSLHKECNPSSPSAVTKIKLTTVQHGIYAAYKYMACNFRHLNISVWWLHWALTNSELGKFSSILSIPAGSQEWS